MAANSAPCLNHGHSLARPDIATPIPSVPEALVGRHIGLADLVRDTICAVRSDISQLSEEIDHIKKVPDDMRRDFRNHIHQDLFSSSRQIPPEILSHIFLQCPAVDWDENSNLFLERRLDRTPLLLGGICSRWRSIALATPRLWTSVSLDIQSESVHTDVLLMETWLARAGQRPLSICLSSSSDYDAKMDPLIELFLSRRSSWKKLLLVLPASMIQSLSSANKPLLQLEELGIRLWCGLWDDDLAAAIDTFECAPQLRYLRLSGESKRYFIRFPWSQLQQLHVDSRHSQQEALDALALTPRLESCILNLEMTRSPNVAATIPLLHLHILSVKVVSGPIYFLDALRAPALRQLSMSFRWSAERLAPQLMRCLSMLASKAHYTHWIWAQSG